MTGSASDGDDACQEALVAIVRGLKSYDGRSEFSTWAYRVTTNACLDELRRRRRRPDPGIPPAVDLPVADSSEAVVAGADVHAALRALLPEFRAALVLRELCDLSYQEIADVLGVPPGTVRSRIARGRAALAPLLPQPEREAPPAREVAGPTRPSKREDPRPEPAAPPARAGNTERPLERPSP